MRIQWVAWSLLALLATAEPALAQPAPPCSGEAMVSTRLYFGASKRRGGEVSDKDWAHFTRSVLVPQFAQGFTVLPGTGWWMDETTKRTRRERSWVVERVHKGGAAEEAAIAAVIATYKERHDQQSVLRTDAAVCARF